jgi:predicted transcriptional regulator
MDNENIITLTSDIVSAHLSHNHVPVEEVSTLIKSVFDALANAGKPVEVIEEKREPAVSIRSSVKADAIACLECGQKMKMLKRHLATDHGLSPEDYKARWNLNADYPLVAPDYAQKRRELAKSFGLGRKPGVMLAKAAVKPTKAPAKRKSAPEASSAAPEPMVTELA